MLRLTVFTAFLHLASTLILTEARAWPPTYGAEFTFTNQEICDASSGRGCQVNTAQNEAAREAWAEKMREICAKSGNCKVFSIRDKYGLPIRRVEYSDGWWFQISVDPAVVEVQTKPTTLAEFEGMRERIHSEVFESARSVNLTPHARTGGGHIHIGYDSAFGKDAVLFRNFLVDTVNHAELGGGGIFTVDRFNSPAAADLDESRKKRLGAIIEKFDQGEIAGPRALAEQVNRRVYDQNPFAKDWTPPQKYQAFNITRVVEHGPGHPEATVELRAFRPQASIDEFLLELRMIEKRLGLLRGLQGRVPYLNPKGNLNAQAKVDGFHAYITEAGLDWNEYRKLMPPGLQNIVPNPPKLPLPELVKEAEDSRSLAAAPRTRCLRDILGTLFRRR